MIFITVLSSIVFMALPAMGVDVVVLHSLDTADHATESFNDGLHKGLNEGVSVSQIFIGNSLHDDDHFDDLFDRLRNEWEGRSATAVIANGETAFAFMRKYREDLFVGAPVIYCGMDRPSPALLSQCGDCTGVSTHEGVQGTVELIFSLLPETTLVVGVMDGTSVGKRGRALAEDAMEPYMDRAQLMFPGYEPGDDNGLTLSALKDVVESLPSRSVLLYLGMTEDAAGGSVAMSDVASIFEQAERPLYVISDGFVGKGALGGVYVTSYDVGLQVATIVNQSLQGVVAGEMLPQELQPGAIVDQTVMSRFGIIDPLLPSGATVLNKLNVHQPPEGVSPTGFAAIVAALGVAVMLYAFMRRGAGRKGR